MPRFCDLAINLYSGFAGKRFSSTCNLSVIPTYWKRLRYLVFAKHPVLSTGGELIFDPEGANLELNAEYIVVVGGGKVQIGTEESPHQGQAAITLHGNVRATELPVYGAKVCTGERSTDPRKWSGGNPVDQGKLDNGGVKLFSLTRERINSEDSVVQFRRQQIFPCR